MADRVLEQLIELFNARKKREAESLARNLTVTSEAFANLILAGRVGALLPQYHYQAHFDEVTPPNLEPTKEEFAALGRNGVGLLKGKALKASRKMGQIFRDRRLLCVHLFYAPSQKYWHMFHFDQRDTTWLQNHWRKGPHVHYASDLMNKSPLTEVWAKVCKRPAEFPKSIHLRYDYHHNRKYRRRGASDA
ncbi:MAG: hypothetical protein ACREVH_10415 [Gammaproteobacteria bacterium]